MQVSLVVACQSGEDDMPAVAHLRESLTAHAEQIRCPVAEASRRGHRLGRWRTNALEHLLRAADHYHGVEWYSSSR